MRSTSRAGIAALSLGAVQAVKDQGLYKCNPAIRSMNQLAMNKIRSLSQINQLSSSSSALVSSSNKAKDQEKLKGSEESLRKVMYLSCWGPN